MDRKINFGDMVELEIQEKGRYKIVKAPDYLEAQGKGTQRSIMTVKKITQTFAPRCSYENLRTRDLDNNQIKGKFLDNGENLLSHAPLEDIAYVVMTPKLTVSQPNLPPAIELYLIDY